MVSATGRRDETDCRTSGYSHEVLLGGLIDGPHDRSKAEAPREGGVHVDARGFVSGFEDGAVMRVIVVRPGTG
jgi:hypothetical protein